MFVKSAKDPALALERDRYNEQLRAAEENADYERAQKLELAQRLEELERKVPFVFLCIYLFLTKITRCLVGGKIGGCRCCCQPID